MTLLTAEDILNKKFQATKFREGYDVEEVDDFLDEVVRTLAAVTEENEDLKAKLAGAEARIAELSRETAASAAIPVQEAGPFPVPTPASASVAPVAAPAPEAEATGMLQLAQKLHDDYVRSGQEEGARLVAEAKAESERVMREAETTAHRTLTQLEQERSLVERKIDELRLFERDYRTRLKSYLQNILGDLDARANSMPTPPETNRP